MHPRRLDTSVGVSGRYDFAVCGSRSRQARAPHPSHPASRFVTIAHTPLLPRRDGARNAADLQVRSTATDWHDGQITCSRQNAVNEIFAVIARSESDEAIQSVPQEDSGLLRFARNDGSKAKRATIIHQHLRHHGGHGAPAPLPTLPLAAKRNIFSNVGWAKRSVPTINIHQHLRHHGGHGASAPLPTQQLSLDTTGKSVRTARKKIRAPAAGPVAPAASRPHRAGGPQDEAELQDNRPCKKENIGEQEGHGFQSCDGCEPVPAAAEAGSIATRWPIDAQGRRPVPLSGDRDIVRCRT
jgi:hypothetical protein